MTAKEYIFSLPTTIDKNRLDGIDTNFQFDISGEKGGQFTVIVKDNEVSTLEGFSGKPKCVVNTSHQVMFDLLEGRIMPMMAMLTKKIVVSDTVELMKNARLFGLI